MDENKFVLGSVPRLLLLMTLVFISGCSSKYDRFESVVNSSDDYYDVMIENKDKLEINNLLSNTTYIQLKDSGKPIGQIDKAVSYMGQIYIMDKTYAKVIFVFDSIGNHIYNVDSFGSGPGQYSTIGDFTIDQSLQELVISETNGKGLKAYNLNDGSFSRTIDIRQINIDELEWIGDGFFINTGNICGRNCYSYRYYDSDGNLISSAIRIPDKIDDINFGDLDIMIRSNDHLLFSQIFNDTIYSFDGIEYSTYAVMDAGKYKVKDESLFRLAKTNQVSFINKAMYFFQGAKRIYETSEILFIESNIEYGLCWTFYFKQNDSYLSSKEISLSENTIQFRIPEGVIFNKLYASIDSDEMNQIRQQIQDSPIIDNIDTYFKEIIQRSHMNDNPVLILYDLNLNLK
jgi:hypothetical protein